MAFGRSRISFTPFFQLVGLFDCLFPMASNVGFINFEGCNVCSFPFLYYKDSIRFYTMQAFHKLSPSFVLMQNETLISFYYPKACQPETTATRFTPTQRSRTHTHTHTQRVPITFTKTRVVAMSTTPLIYYSYHSYTLRTCIVAGRGILGVF